MSVLFFVSVIQTEGIDWKQLYGPIAALIALVVLNVLIIRFTLWLRRRMQAIAEPPEQQRGDSSEQKQ
jgi:hypothetical protein